MNNISTRLILAGTIFGLVGCGSSLPVKMSANKTFSEPMQQIKVDGIGTLTDSKKILVPSNWVQTMVSGEQKSSRGGAHAKATVHIGAMTTQLGEEIASELYDDFTSKLRQDGWQVLTYADIKNNPDVADIDRMKIDNDYGFTGIEKNYGHGDKVWMFSSPATTPTFDLDFTGTSPPMADFHKIAQNMGAHMVWPRYVFVTPVMYSEDDRGYKKSYASVGMVPALEFSHVFSGMRFNSAKGGWGSVYLAEPKRVNESVGDIRQVSSSSSQDKSLFIFDVFRSISKGDYAMTLDVAAYKHAALQAGKDFNTLTVEAFNAALTAE